MQCPITPTIWQRLQDGENDQVAQHLATCDACRAEAGQLATLRAALAALPVPEVTAEVGSRLQMLAEATAGHSLSCREVRGVLDAWLDGALDRPTSFLVQDHLLECAPCALEVDKAEALLAALRALPQLDAPAAVAERIELARVPWWKKLFPTPAPVWSRQFGLAAGLAAVVVLAMVSMQRAPQVTSPQTAVIPSAPVKTADVGLPTAPPVVAAPAPPRVVPATGPVTDTRTVISQARRRIRQQSRIEKTPAPAPKAPVASPPKADPVVARVVLPPPEPAAPKAPVYSPREKMENEMKLAAMRTQLASTDNSACGDIGIN